MQSSDEKEVLYIEEVELELESRYTKYPIDEQSLFVVASILILIPNVVVIFFMIQKNSRTFLDDLIIYDCFLRQRVKEA